MDRSPPASTAAGKIRGSASEAKRIFAEAEAQRLAATSILRPEAISGLSDPVSTLITTINGESRYITREDLIAFERNINRIKIRSGKHKLQQGIRAQQVIAMAAPSPNMIGRNQRAPNTDMGRANSEIKTAILLSAQKGLLNFRTNASGKSLDKHGRVVTKHFVNIRLASYPEAATMPRKPEDTGKVAAWLLNEPLKFECDCGRHTYWYRYMASIGGWCEGRLETGYPKERNPNLRGVACKHVLRVMRELVSNRFVKMKVVDMLKSDAGKTKRTTQKEADRIIKSQKRNPKAIDQDKAKRETQRLMEKLQRKLASKLAEEYSRKGASASKQAAILALQAQFKAGRITKTTYETILKGLQ